MTTSTAQELSPLFAEAAKILGTYPPPATRWRNPLEVAQRVTLTYTRTVQRPTEAVMQEDRDSALYNRPPAVHAEKRPVNIPLDVTIDPGGEIELPSMYDGAIQQVMCNERDCRDHGGYCRKNHEGRIMAGLAPQLVRIGGRATLAPALADAAANEGKRPAPVRVLPRRKVEG
ncbi:MAG TPA: hypothetical protein VIY73_15760 [Polyangiaceae bacterium]